MYLILGRHGDYRFVTSENAASDETVGRLDMGSVERLRDVCVYLAAQVPSAGLTELLDSVWRITEFYTERPPKLTAGARAQRSTEPIARGASRGRPPVHLAEG